jgi:hypothetical protein
VHECESSARLADEPRCTPATLCSLPSTRLPLNIPLPLRIWSKYREALALCRRPSFLLRRFIHRATIAKLSLASIKLRRAILKTWERSKWARKFRPRWAKTHAPRSCLVSIISETSFELIFKIWIRPRNREVEVERNVEGALITSY